MSTDPLDEIQWKSPEWIQQFGLHTGNVLDYFTESPFFDRTSNNQVLRMQFQFQQIPPNINPINYMQSKLTEMVGVEFIVAYIREPDFWIIRKQQRLDANSTLPQQDYYIIGANIYQAPKIYDILSSRLLASALAIKKSVDLLNNMSTYSISDGGHQYTKASPASTAASTTAMSISNTNSTNTPAPGTTNTTNTTAPTTEPTTGPTTATTAAATAAAASRSAAAADDEIAPAAFDGLLKSVVNSGNDASIYLDDLPLYGKGSTVESLKLKINLEDD